MIAFGLVSELVSNGMGTGNAAVPRLYHPTVEQAGDSDAADYYYPGNESPGPPCVWISATIYFVQPSVWGEDGLFFTDDPEYVFVVLGVQSKSELTVR